MTSTPITPVHNTVQLPSRGRFYKGNLNEGEVKIRRFGAGEESILNSNDLSPADRIYQMIDRCLLWPAELRGKFDPDQLLLTDRMAILLALRTLTFKSGTYKFPFRCQFCGKTGKGSCDIIEEMQEESIETQEFKLIQKSKEDAQLGKIDEPLPDDFTITEPLKMTLPENGAEISLHFLRGKHEQQIIRYSDRAAMRSNDAADSSFIYRIALQITAINGNNVPQSARESFVKTLSMLDTAAIRTFVDAREPGIDTRIYPRCKGCGGVNEMDMPFSIEFFRPASL